MQARGRGARGLGRQPAPRGARTATTCCCASCCAATRRATRRRRTRESARRLRRPRAARLPAARGERRLCASATATQFEHVLVDEFQDTNRLQIRLLAAAGRRRRPAVHGRRRVPVDLRLPSRRRPGLPRVPRRRPPSTVACAPLRHELPQPPGDPGGAERGLRAALGRRLRAARARRRRAAPAADQLQLDLNGSTPARRRAGRRADRRRPGDGRAGRTPATSPFGASLAGLAAVARGRDAPARRPHQAADRRRPRPGRHRRAAARGASTCRSTSARCASAASRPTWSAGATTGRSSRWPTCARTWRVLANPLDEEALYSVLGSPLGGLSLDAIGLLGLRRAAARRATRGGR